MPTLGTVERGERPGECPLTVEHETFWSVKQFLIFLISLFFDLYSIIQLCQRMLERTSLVPMSKLGTAMLSEAESTDLSCVVVEDLPSLRSRWCVRTAVSTGCCIYTAASLVHPGTAH